MPRIRQIRPEFWSDEKVTRLSFGARLLLIALWSFADDHGRGRAYPRELAGFAFPTDEVEVEPLLTELAGSGIVHFFLVDGLPMYHLPNWRKHQKVDRLLPSRLPDPTPYCGACRVASGPSVLAEVAATIPARTQRADVEPSSDAAPGESAGRPCRDQERVPDPISEPSLSGNRNLEIGNSNSGSCVEEEEAPGCEVEADTITLAHRDRLQPLLQGTMFSPRDVPGRVLAIISRKGQRRRNGPEVYEAARELAEDADRYVGWLVEALRRARSNAKPSMLLDYAAGVIARALEGGEDLAKVVEVAAVPQAQGEPAAWKEVW
jgi:hypothetical protein